MRLGKWCWCASMAVSEGVCGCSCALKTKPTIVRWGWRFGGCLYLELIMLKKRTTLGFHRSGATFYARYHFVLIFATSRSLYGFLEIYDYLMIYSPVRFKRQLAEQFTDSWQKNNLQISDKSCQYCKIFWSFSDCCSIQDFHEKAVYESTDG